MFCLLTLVAFNCVQAAESFKLRPEGVGSIARKSAPLPKADRIEIYVTGPKWDVDARNSVADLRKRGADLIITNKSDINRVFALLHPKEEKAKNERLAARDGYTYHLLAVKEQEGEISHIRVLDPGDSKTGAAEIYLRPGTSFCYVNEQIGPWLQASIGVDKLDKAGRR
jgi:hypothetical protein